MKLHRLELTGFGPFRERQVVDFDAFDADGVFLISGRTGAGKSSILDGVCFALYGSVPRYDGGDRRLRSDHCYLDDPTEVRLEFTVGDARWRVTRAPDYERPAKRGGGMTTEPPRAELEELVGETWVGRAGKPRDVGQALDGVLGLNAQQFQQVILLAQNRFSRFLLAGNNERQALLRTLFGTRRFEQHKDALEQRRKDAQKRLDAGSENARTLLDVAERLIDEHDLAGADERPADLTGRRDAAQHAQQRAEYRVEQTVTARALADTALTTATAVHEDLAARARRLADLAAGRRALAELEDRDPAVEADRVRLAHARAAEALRAPLESAERAVAELEGATAQLARARADWTAAGGDGGAEIAALIEKLTGDLARWEAAAAQERELAAHESDLAAQQAAVSRLVTQLAQLDEHLARIPEQRAGLEAELSIAQKAAARAGDLRQRRAVLDVQHDAAHEAATLAGAANAADDAYVVANAAAQEAIAAVTRLLRRRVAGYAGELSARLVAGEPCEVCGSIEHPHPAASSEDAVTDDDLAVAESLRDAATAEERTAGEGARAARERCAEAAARAGGRDAESLRAEIAEIAAELIVADAAIADVERLTRWRADLDEGEATARAEREDVATRLAAQKGAEIALHTTVERLRRDVVVARGGHASVAERLAAVTAERDRARALADAQTTAAERARAQATATADRDARVAASPFPDAAAATAALADEATRVRLDARVADHAAALTAARARLLELELDAVDEAVSETELAAAADAVIAADTARTAAIAAHRDALNAAERLRDLLVHTDEAYARVAELAEASAVVTRLADTVAGRAPNTLKMDLETFVLAAELEEIVHAANLRLAEMSSGRYTLHHSDARQARGAASGLAIEVLDAHTGRLRSPQSLSGGETFLASLSLALGLAEVVTSRAGGLRLDTLFVDEGFGSLDPETLDLAMRTLDELRAGGRTVGVISHVEAMKEQLPAQLVVEATPEGPSVVRQAATLPQ